MKSIAVVFAGGIGSRMHSKDKPKQFLTIHEKPIIIHTLELFDSHPEISDIVIACIESWIPHLLDLIKKYNIKKVAKVVPGGESGQLSIYNGLIASEEIAAHEKCVVLIHDGVRPLITLKTISDNIDSVKRYGSAITSVKVKETVMIVSDDLSIEYIPSREHSRLARAPQSFWLDEIIALYRKAIECKMYSFIDSCTMLQYFGKKIFLVDGPHENIKITTPDDFYTMRALLDAKENAQIYGFDE